MHIINPRKVVELLQESRVQMQAQVELLTTQAIALEERIDQQQEIIDQQEALLDAAKQMLVDADYALAGGGMDNAAP